MTFKESKKIFNLRLAEHCPRFWEDMPSDDLDRHYIAVAGTYGIIGVLNERKVRKNIKSRHSAYIIARILALRLDRQTRGSELGVAWRITAPKNS